MKTFLATTQCGRKGSFPAFHMNNQLKPPNPVIHTPRQHEAVATDTVHGPKGIPAVDNGSTAAQIFVGRVSGQAWVKGCGKSDKTFVKALYDCIKSNLRAGYASQGGPLTAEYTGWKAAATLPAA